MRNNLSRKADGRWARRLHGAGRRLQFEALEDRLVLSFVPPPITVTPTNPVQTVRVIALNYEPTVPSRDNQTLWQIFGWQDPRQLAAGYLADVEAASGGAIDYEIVDWRDLNEFPIFTDGFRYTADQYVENRMTNTGWNNSPADFYVIAEQQGLADLVNNNEIDEIWMFGDHFFNLLGEAWMAGPASFFVNGPSFPDFPVDRAVAGFGFSYERGVAEMLHNLGHRTENHGSRAYGGWNIANPVTAWDYFTANVGQTNRAEFGVGSTHLPFNGMDHYDYANTGTVGSYADDFVFNFPNHTYAAVPMSRDAWGDLGVGDWHRAYQQWFFGHVPRTDGTAPDGRQNNWYKYIYDFNSYRPTTGLPRDNEAILGAPPLTSAGCEAYSFTLRYYDLQGIDAATLDSGDVLVTGPNGYSQLASLVEIGPQQATTAGTARTVRYQVTGPGGAWGSGDSGTYTASLRASQVSDVNGAFLPAANLGSFQVNLPTASRLDVAAMLAAGQATVAATTWDIGGPAAIFDDSASSLYRTPNIDPAVVTLSFAEPQTFTGFRALFSHAGGNPAYRWKVESANSLADLDGQAGSYQLLVPLTGTASDVFSAVTLASAVTAAHVRLTAERLTGDNYVHINAWELLSTGMSDAAVPTAELIAAPVATPGASSTSFAVRYSDDRAIDIRSVNFGDVRVVGPNGFEQTAAFYGLDLNANGATREATYFVSPPSGKWVSSDNGTYTISLVAGQVFDTAGNAVAPGVLGSFVVDVPLPQTRPRADMTELNASDWLAWAQAAMASTSDDTAVTVLGDGSVRFDTDGGFDTYVRYEPASGTMWDLSQATEFYFHIRAQNPSPIGFQAEPIVRFIDLDGDVIEFRYYRSGSPYPLWNEARGAWRAHSIPIKSMSQPATGWRAAAIGTPDWTRMRTVEIHADTWDAGFTLWFDRAGFNLPVQITSATFEAGGPPRHRLNLGFDESVGATLEAADVQIRNVQTQELIPAGSISIAAPDGLQHQITFPGYANGVLPTGAYELLLAKEAVSDAAGNTLEADFRFGFVVLNGDSNGDDLVDAADYVLWRRALGSTSEWRADGDGSGVVDEGDYGVWRANFGVTNGAGGGAQAAGSIMAAAAAEPVATGSMAAAIANFAEADSTERAVATGITSGVPARRVVFDPAPSLTLKGRTAARAANLQVAPERDGALAAWLAIRCGEKLSRSNDASEIVAARESRATFPKASIEALDSVFESLAAGLGGS